MKLKFNLLLCLLFPLFTFAKEGDVTYKRTVTKNFTVNANAAFSLSNKYGKVVFHAWNKNEIKAIVTITGFGKKVDEAQAIAEMVDITTEKDGPSAVALRTNYNPKSGSSWFSWGGKKDSKEYVNIDYDVYIPQSLSQLNVENNFGDVIADKFSFPVTLSMNYCSYDIREAEDLQLRINYCEKGRIGKAGKVVIKGNYSDLKAEQLGGLDVNSNYSNYVVTSVGDLRVASNYDDFKLERAKNVSGHVTFTDTRFNELEQQLNLKTTYGDIVVKKVSGTFKGADLILTYSDLKMTVGSRQPLQLDILLVNGGLSKGGLELKNVVSNKTASTLRYTAQAGGGNEQSPVIKIKGTNSDVKLEVD